MNTIRRVSYVFLCIVPFLNFVVVGVRAFRVSGVYQAVGVAYFAAIAIAAWTLSAGRSEPMCRVGDCLAWRGHSLSQHLRSLRFSGLAWAGPGRQPRQKTRCGISSSLLWLPR